MAEELETVMIGSAAELAVEVAIPVDVTIRRIEVGPHLHDEVARVSSMQARVFGGNAGRDPERVADQIAGDPQHQALGPEAGGEVVAAGSLDVVAGTEFAGLWGGAVRAEWRGLRSDWAPRPWPPMACTRPRSASRPSPGSGGWPQVP